MRRILALTAAACLSLSCVGVSFALTGEEYNTVQQLADEYLSGNPDDGYYVSADDLSKRLQSGKDDFVLLDVRGPSKEKTYDLGRIPGAVYISYKEAAKPKNLAKLPKDKDIIVYCNTGHEESKVLSVLRMLGYKAYGLKWGYMAWKTAGPTGLTLKAIEGSILTSYPVEK